MESIHRWMTQIKKLVASMPVASQRIQTSPLKDGIVEGLGLLQGCNRTTRGEPRRRCNPRCPIKAVLGLTVGKQVFPEHAFQRNWRSSSMPRQVRSLHLGHVIMDLYMLNWRNKEKLTLTFTMDIRVILSYIIAYLCVHSTLEVGGDVGSNKKVVSNRSGKTDPELCRQTVMIPPMDEVATTVKQNYNSPLQNKPPPPPIFQPYHTTRLNATACFVFPLPNLG